MGEDHQIAGAAANIHIDRGHAVHFAVNIRTSAAPSDDAFQIWSGCRYYEVPRQTAQRLEYLRGIFLAGGLTGDDHCSRIHLCGRDAGMLVFLLDDLSELRPIQLRLTDQRRKMDGAAVDDLLVRDHDARHAEARRLIGHRQP